MPSPEDFAALRASLLARPATPATVPNIFTGGPLGEMVVNVEVAAAGNDELAWCENFPREGVVCVNYRADPDGRWVFSGLTKPGRKESGGGVS